MYIFNFHCVQPKLRSGCRKHITITQKGLAQFIQIIRWIGLEPVSLLDVVFNGRTESMASNYACLTFDDGYEDFYKYAAPVLLAEDCPATVFVLPGKFSGTNDWDYGHLPVHERDRLMSLEQMQKLGQTGLITFGSHGMGHRHLSKLSQQELLYEIDDSYRILSNELGTAFVPVFAYPWGEYSDAVLHVMKTSPYSFAFTTQKGEWKDNNDPYRIPRYTARYRDKNALLLLLRLFRHRIGVFSANNKPTLVANTEETASI